MMKIMDKGLTEPKWVLINWPKISQIHKNLFSQSAQRFGILLKKGFIGRLIVKISSLDVAICLYLNILEAVLKRSLGGL